MNDQVTVRSQISDAPFYVLCNDSFMSGCGHAAGEINTLIFPCESHDQALIVEQNARNRSDMRYVRVVANKPRLKPLGYLYQVKTPDTYPNWYQVGYFKRS